MSKSTPTKDELIAAIKSAANALGRSPSRSQFFAHSGLNQHNVFSHFDSWNEAVAAAGFEPNRGQEKISDAALLEDWGQVVRRLREIPTTIRYRREGEFSADAIQTRFGAWVRLPDVFRAFAAEKPEWADVVALLPVPQPARQSTAPVPSLTSEVGAVTTQATTNRHSKLANRPSYGNPIDFRGLRHEPVNEQGVVFLFGMVAKEMGYMVEAVQTGYPDCEAKRQVGPSNWQRVRIEFEFESRNFRDHGHPPDGCDVIVCWRHNWAECPEHLEVVELSSVIQMLSKSED